MPEVYMQLLDEGVDKDLDNMDIRRMTNKLPFDPELQEKSSVTGSANDDSGEGPSGKKTKSRKRKRSTSEKKIPKPSQQKRRRKK